MIAPNTPKELGEVPAFHAANLQTITSERAVVLSDLLGRTYNPESGEVVADCASRIQRALAETYQIVGDLAEGPNTDLFRKHVSLSGLPTLPDNSFDRYYKSPEEIEQEEGEQLALRVAAEAGVLYVAERQSPPEGAKTITKHATIIGRPALQLAIEARGFETTQRKIQTLEAVLGDIDSSPLAIRLACLGMRWHRRYDLGQYKRQAETHRANILEGLNT